MSISPAMVVTGLPWISWCSVTRTSSTYRASCWNASPLSVPFAPAPAGTGIDCQRLPLFIQARPPRTSTCIAMSPPFGTPDVRIENHSPSFDVAPLNSIWIFIPSAEMPRLPSKVDDAELRLRRFRLLQQRLRTHAFLGAAAGEQERRRQHRDEPDDHVRRIGKSGRLHHPPLGRFECVDEELTRSVRAAMPYADTLGLELLSASPDEVRGRVAWEERLTTAAGLLHGGVLMGLADAIGAYCAFLNLPEGSTATATIESKTNFFAAVRSGTVEARSRPLHRGSRTVVVETDLFDESGKHVARVTQTQAVL